MPPEDKTQKQNPADLGKFNLDVNPVFKPKNLAEQSTKSTTSASISDLLKNQVYTPTTAIPANNPNIKTPITGGSQLMNEKGQIVSKNQPPTVQTMNPKSVVRTYRGDVESIIQSSHISSINIALAETNRVKNTGNSTPPAPPKNSKNRFLILLSIFLILGAGFLIFYYYQNKTTPVVRTNVNNNQILTTEYSEEINIDLVNQDKLEASIAGRLGSTQIEINSLYSLYLTSGQNQNKKLLSALDLINLLKLNVPENLKRTLRPQFMIGMYSFGENLPFIILKTSSFDNTYAGLLEWEKSMEKDLGQILLLPSRTEANLLQTKTAKPFEDAVMRNQDVRILRDDDGKMILIYSIIDKDTIIITVNEKSFREILDRFNREKSLQR